jgi:hypothetical protein
MVVWVTDFSRILPVDQLMLLRLKDLEKSEKNIED